MQARIRRNDSNLYGFASIGMSHRYLDSISGITEKNKECCLESRILTSFFSYKCFGDFSNL